MTRSAGILLHISSLPSPFGIGTLGQGAYGFVDFLHASGMTVWQILPLQPTGFGDSPYQSVSASALNPYFIDPSILCKKGLLTESDVEGAKTQDERVDYATLFTDRYALLRKAYAHFDRYNAQFLAWKQACPYLDYARYMTLKTAHGFASPECFVPAYRNPHSAECASFFAAHADEVDFWLWTQYEFLAQWLALKSYANERGISILGDIPLYVSCDSAEAWAHPELFRLNEQGQPDPVAGVPPDYFSETGQLWGNPVYNWCKMKEDGYAWWNDRINNSFALYDALRIDHFRGFDRYYTIPAGAPDARTGAWEQGPGMALFSHHGGKRIVAEDLGMIDDGVRALLADTGYPGMRVAEFGLDGSPDNCNTPSAYPENVVGYTGTHDNAPLLAWLNALTESEREIVLRAVKAEGKKLGVPARTKTNSELCATVTRLTLASKAHLVILPWQDVIKGDAATRMNTPGESNTQNWTYRAAAKDFTPKLAKKLADLLAKYARA